MTMFKFFFALICLASGIRFSYFHFLPLIFRITVFLVSDFWSTLLSVPIVMPEVTGKVKKKTLDEETEIEWEISNFFSLLADNFHICSPIFCFPNSSTWYFQMYGENSLDPNFMALYLCNNNEREYSVEYSFGIKKRGCEVEHLFRRVMLGGDSLTHQWKFIKRSEILQRNLELVPSGNFTVSCKLKCDLPVSSIHPTVLDKPKLEKLRKLDTLSENFKSLFVNKYSCDVTLHVKEKEYKAHRAVLIARSPVFAAMFLHETSEKKTGIVNISDCDPDTFEEFLEFLYSGALHKLSFSTALYLYETSNKYDVQELKLFCRECLMANLSVENVCDVVIAADKYDEENLISAAQDFFNENLDEIFDTSEWDTLVKKNYRLAKKLLKGMSSKMKAVR